MTNNFFTLRHIAETLDSSLKGVAIAGAFSQERDILAIALEGRAEHVVVSCRGDFSTCYIDQRVSRARRNTVDVLPALTGNIFRSVSICPGDRVVTATFHSGQHLVMQFFGTRSNAFVVGSDGILIDAFHDAKSLVHTSYSPSPPRSTASPEELVSRVSLFSELELQIALRKAFPVLGSTLAHEIIFRSGLANTLPARNLHEQDYRALQSALRAVFDDLRLPSPCIYLAPDASPRLLSIVPLAHLEPSEKRFFPTIHEAIQVYFALRQSTARHQQQATQVRAVLDGARTRAMRTLAAMVKDEEDHDRASLYQEYGSLLMAHLTSIPAGAAEYNASAGEREASIPLDPRLTPVQNAQRYFEKSKHARLARQQSEDRKIFLRHRIAAAESLLSVLDAATIREEFDAFMKTHSEELEEFGIGKKGPIQRELPFRMFVVEGGFDVWAGKDNAGNDLLTLHHAKPNDLWFHARGSPGSHVVLRVATGNGVPGKKSKQQAAAIAAYYSKMRNARMVPVTMTERKYVRKPKGAAPGSVLVTHEETLFAEPQLPEQSTKHSSPDHT
jgi:predicted ribosome quality control (RQC) complex YloA/Tae2 family protein